MPAEEVTLPLAAVLRPELAFARSVLRLRLERGWTQRQLAGEAGIAQAAVSGIEAHARGCRMIAAAWRMAEALEVPLDSMIRGEAAAVSPGGLAEGDPADIDGEAVPVGGVKGLVTVGPLTMSAREARRLAARITAEGEAVEGRQPRRAP